MRVESHAETILAAARESGVDPNLLAGIMMVESRGHVDARSPVGALGLFQLLPPTAAEQAAELGLGKPTEKELLSDARLNARLGARYIAWLTRRSGGDVERALVAYNAGPGRLQRWIKEAGSYAAWRDARERAGDSQVLAYARDVLDYRARFAARGEIAPTARGEPDTDARKTSAPNPAPARLPLPLSSTVEPDAAPPAPIPSPSSDQDPTEPASLDPNRANPVPAPIGPPREPPDDHRSQPPSRNSDP